MANDFGYPSSGSPVAATAATTLSATDVDATTKFPLSKAGAANQILSTNLLRAILAQSTNALSTTSTQGLVQAEPATTGTPSSSLVITRPAHTTLTASTEYSDVNLTAATQQFATGALTTQRAVRLQAPTYGFVGASTITTAVNLSVAKPVAGTNATITRSYAVDAEDSRVTGTLTVLQSGGTPGTDQIVFSYAGGVGVVTLGGGNGGLSIGSTGAGYLQASQYILIDSIARLQQGVGLRLASTGKVGFTSTSESADAFDVAVARAAPTVLSITNGSSGTGWVQNSAGDARVASDVTNATATMANLTDLSVTLVAGRKYGFRYVIKCANSTAAEGIKFDLDGGSATVTSLAANAYVTTGGTFVGVNQVTSALATDLTFSTITNETWVVIEGSLVCNAAGTLIPRFSENTSAAGTATVYANSTRRFWDIP